MTRLNTLAVLIATASLFFGCGSDANPDRRDGGDSSTPPRDAGTLPDGGPVLDGDTPPPPPLPDGGRPPDRPPAEGFPEGNEWSWDGSWTPGAGDFPLAGLFDNEYGDGHDGTPVLPPGEWDWNDSGDDLANWRNFETNLGSFEPLMDSGGNQYGWRLVGTMASVDYQGPAAYFEGSTGVDYLDLGSHGSMHSFSAGNLGAGPDVLIFDSSYSLDFRTGTTADGGDRDDDLVIAGCHPNSDGEFNVLTTTIHTGPGHDWVFMRDVSRAAVDLGNGNGGRTDTLDPADGDDLVVLRGNTHDFRVFGGQGDDVFVWFVDDNIQTTTWLGPNFFGGGGWGDALFDENGTDRLVLAIPTDTTMVTTTPTPAGGLLVLPRAGEYIVDDPTVGDDLARYCVECGMGDDGERTIVLEYNSADGMIETGYFFLTGVEEVQVGVGEGAVVYRLDTVAGTATRIEGAELFDPPVPPPELCE